jgi:SAM-dependent methyltransferase
MTALQRPTTVTECDCNPDATSLAKLKEYYRNSEGYRTHLQAKGPAYFERFVSVVYDCSSPSDRILDLGCGTGESTLEITRRNRNVIGTDISQLFMASPRNRDRMSPAFVASDACQLPFLSHSFDVVCATEFIEHVWPVDAVLDEMHRVLKPSGRIVLASPNLLSPLWPLRDLPGILLKRRFRPPWYCSYREATAFFLRACRMNLRKVRLSEPEFLPRHPDIEHADSGGDYDSVYYSHAQDIVLFLRQRGYDVHYAIGAQASFRSRVRMSVASTFGSIWTSFLLKGTKSKSADLVPASEV